MKAKMQTRRGQVHDVHVNLLHFLHVYSFHLRFLQLVNIVKLSGPCWYCHKYQVVAYTYVFICIRHSFRMTLMLFSLPCGHVFCGECLLSIFQTHLEYTFKSLASCLNLPPDTFMPLPSTYDQRDWLVELLKRYGMYSNHILTYYCPMPICPGKCVQAPTLTYAHGRLIESFLSNLQECFGSTTTLAIVPVTGTEIFEGLFARTGIFEGLWFD